MISYSELYDQCEAKGLHLEISRLPDEKISSGLMEGKWNFEGWIVRVVKQSKRICRAEMRPGDSFDDIAADLHAFLKKEKNL